ncbi:MAG: DUF452 family protein [Clostridium sp.]|nr:DUF452 family protein [Clostridium sp.]
MKAELTVDNGSRRLLMFFAGWGMDSNPLTEVSAPGFDTMILFDYASDDDPDDRRLAVLLGQYDEICIVAWSFGVANAANFMARHPGLPVTLRVAVNGTLRPVDDLLGIPVQVYSGTLGSFSPRMLEKFRLRMTGSREAYTRFSDSLPQRSNESLLDELRLMEYFRGESAPSWDLAVVGRDDRIFPPENQLRHWSELNVTVREIDAPHMPQFKSLIRSLLVNKELVGQRFGNAAQTYDLAATVQREVAGRLASLLPPAESNQRISILEIGAGTGFLTRHLRRLYPDAELTLWDLAAQQEEVCECDAETEIRRVADAEFDLIVSSSTVQWFHSPGEFLRQCRRVLRPGGRVVLSTYLPGTYSEISDIAGHSIPYPDEERWRRMATDAGFEIDGMDTETRRLEFGTTRELFEHMRLTGVNALSDRPVAATLRLLRYGVSTLTYRPLFLVMV